MEDVIKINSKPKTKRNYTATGVKEEKKQFAKDRYAKCVKLHDSKCWLSDRDDVRFNFHHKKMKSIYGGTEISKLCKSDVPWKTIEDELKKCVLISQHGHLSYHNFLRLFKNKQEETYEFSLIVFKEAYRQVKEFNDVEIQIRKELKGANKRKKK